MDCKTTATRGSRRTWLVAATVAALTFCGGLASAEPLRLRADALATTSPVGLIMLQGDDRARPWIDAEASVWAGAKPSATGDVLVLAVRVHDSRRWTELRGGRFVLSTGAVRPVQIDGAQLTLRAPWGSAVEAFGGAPVVPRFGARAYDWLAGGRVSHKVGVTLIVGVSYLQRRDNGEISDHEVGADAAFAPARWLDIAGYGTYDLSSSGLAEARVSAASRIGDVRLETFASDRSPSRLLPATSLFSVLGDFPSQSIGATARWRAAPRLDLLLSLAGQDVAGAFGANGFLRTTLRLEDAGDRSVGLELRRVDVSSAQWSGLRGVTVQPIGRGLRASSEVEIVVPDHPGARGRAWPWGLLALSYRSASLWELACAVEAASTPSHLYETNALVRLSRAWGLP